MDIDKKMEEFEAKLAQAIEDRDEFARRELPEDYRRALESGGGPLLDDGEEEEELVIETGVPIPAGPSRYKHGSYIEKMKIGDSIKFDTTEKGMNFAKLLNQFGYGYLTASEFEGLRVWKVAKKRSKKKEGK